MAAFKGGKWDDALAAFQEAERSDPRDPIVQSWLGFVEFKRGRFTDSVRYLERSLQLAPGNPETFNNLGNAKFALGDSTGAVAAYRQAVELIRDRPGSHADYFYNLGNALVKRGDLDPALEAFQEAAKRSPQDPLIRNNLGYTLERKNLDNPVQFPISAAVEQYRLAVEREPGNAIFHRNLGLAARKGVAGDSALAELAMKSLKRAIDLDRKDYQSHLALAEEYQNRNQIQEAVAEYRIATALREKEYVPRYNLGLLYARQAAAPGLGNAARLNFYNQAMVVLTEAAALRSTDPRVLSALGWVCLNTSKLTEAASWYEKAIQASPDPAATQPFHANLALVYDRLAQLDRGGKPAQAATYQEKALKHWKEALRLDPTDLATRRAVAASYLAQNQYESAAAELEEVVKQEPKDAGSWVNLGYAREKLSKLELALAAYRKAIEANPRLAIAHNNLGACYERQGQRELAKECYLKASQIDPGLQDARRNLERLGGG